ncbi:MAG TPA: DUF4296 domain-containing protein [Chryseolinea sp.]|nr:DUF4296 domain-containing protein [Chryseolinea sp.]
MQVKRLVYYFILLVSLFLEVSCGGKEEKSEKVLSQAEMVSTLMDIYIAEQKSTFITTKQDSSEFIFKKLNAKVLESHNVQDSVLKKSFDYYLAHPKEMEAIYTAIVDSLNLREQRITSQSTDQ